MLNRTIRTALATRLAVLDDLPPVLWPTDASDPAPADLHIIATFKSLTRRSVKGVVERGGWLVLTVRGPDPGEVARLSSGLEALLPVTGPGVEIAPGLAVETSTASAVMPDPPWFVATVSVSWTAYASK